MLFLILLAPFDVTDLEVWVRWVLLPFYGVLLITAYLLSLPIQNRLLKRRNDRWQLEDELTFISVFLFICFFFCFAYYQSSIMNGEQDLLEFFLYQYIPISIIIVPMVLFLRWTAGRLSQKTTHIAPVDTKVILEGEAQKDILRLDLQQITHVKAADNYVEVYYLENDQIQMKLLRSTLKKINTKVPALLRTHRSYLINPTHFQQWVNPNCLIIHQTEIPISKTYKSKIEQVLSFAPDQG
ncbi:MAG: LytTR family DNA-binding domain-containing protein [Bacteroidota bacterium]